jgi:hypothetical protein
VCSSRLAGGREETLGPLSGSVCLSQFTHSRSCGYPARAVGVDTCEQVYRVCNLGSDREGDTVPYKYDAETGSYTQPPGELVYPRDTGGLCIEPDTVSTNS